MAVRVGYVLRSQLLSAGARAMSTAPEPQVLFDRPSAGCGRIVLNRPKQLNALTLDMIHDIYPQLKSWAADDSVRLVLMKGSGVKAFCAGGDVVAMVRSGQSTDDKRVAHSFTFDEYKLNHLLGTYNKPYVALLNGITMGGGVGLSVHAAYRVSTDHTLFAMPETAIGLFPDVGGGYFLPRLAGSLGMYLGLTGQRLKGADCFLAGISTHHCPAASMDSLEQELQATQSKAELEDVLQKYHVSANVHCSSFSLLPHLEAINRIFSKASVEEILSALNAEPGEWATGTLGTLSKMSPTSLKVTHRQVAAGGSLSFEQVFAMEYRISQRFLDPACSGDFFEGTVDQGCSDSCTAINRSAPSLIEKDNAPRWQPASLDQVTEQLVDAFFERLPADRELDVREPMELPATEKAAI